jgi:hypothetical protein
MCPGLTSHFFACGHDWAKCVTWWAHVWYALCLLLECAYSHRTTLHWQLPITEQHFYPISMISTINHPLLLHLRQRSFWSHSSFRPCGTWWSVHNNSTVRTQTVADHQVPARSFPCLELHTTQASLSAALSDRWHTAIVPKLTQFHHVLLELYY